MIIHINYYPLVLCTDLLYSDSRRKAGCVFIPHYNAKRYGRQSIKLSCILNWNQLSEVLSLNLLTFTKPKLKKSITQHFLSTYSRELTQALTRKIDFPLPFPHIDLLYILYISFNYIFLLTKSFNRERHFLKNLPLS